MSVAAIAVARSWFAPASLARSCQFGSLFSLRSCALPEFEVELAAGEARATTTAVLAAVAA